MQQVSRKLRTYSCCTFANPTSWAVRARIPSWYWSSIVRVIAPAHRDDATAVTAFLRSARHTHQCASCRPGPTPIWSARDPSGTAGASAIHTWVRPTASRSGLGCTRQACWRIMTAWARTWA